MPALSTWKYARSPNYEHNRNKLYPYSEVPYLGEYNLVKIPITEELIKHIDYWGEGRITVEPGVSGFPNCYNINHVHQLVSNGLDTNRKIPNRIPVISYTNCDTSSYIKSNSVELVTIMGAPINDSCAYDIGRMINGEDGRVVAYGFDENSAEIRNLTRELKKKGLLYCYNFGLPDNLQGLTLFESYLAYVNSKELSDYLYQNIVGANYESAVINSKVLHENGQGSFIFDVVTKVLKAGNKNLMSYAYKLWNTGAQAVVSNYFPEPFQTVFKGDNVIIVSSYFNLALKLDTHTDTYNDRQAWGDSNDKSSGRVLWKMVPVWNNNFVTFKILNIEYGMHLKLDVNTDDLGDRKAWGAKNFDEERFEWFLEPKIVDDNLIFLIINEEYKQGLKLDAHTDSYNDRLLWGHHGTVYYNPNYFGWLIKNK